MRKSIFVVCFLVVCTFAITSSALAVEGMYVSGNVGAVALSDSDVSVDGYSGSLDLGYDTGYALTVAVGRKVEYVRLEGELGYRATDMEGYNYTDSSITASLGGDVKALSFMVNTYFDINTGTSFTPFIGGGIGFANIDAEVTGTLEEDGEVVLEGSEGDDDTVFAYQVIAGVAFAMTDNTFLDLSYRYFATSDPEFGDIRGEYGGHNLMLGLRYSF